MSWLHVLVMGASGIAAMRAALERGDIDEAARQGATAGPAVVERALASPDRTTRLAGIAAAPLVEDRGELLAALARVAGGADWRTAIPAATAARTIARQLAHRAQAGYVADDIADDDLASWRAVWGELALRGDRWVELRVIALDVAAALDQVGSPGGTGGVALDRALQDPDPAFRRAAATVVALPVPAASWPALAATVVHDADLDVALGAAQSLCLSLDAGAPRPVLDALGADGLARIRALVAANRPEQAALRDAARCLTADGSPDNVAAARTIPPAPRAAAHAPPAPAGDDATTPTGPAANPAHGRAPRTRRGGSH
jgi:hypothetical protein